MDQLKTNTAPKTLPWAVASSWLYAQARQALESHLPCVSVTDTTQPRRLSAGFAQAPDASSRHCHRQSSWPSHWLFPDLQAVPESTPLLCLSLNRTQKRRVILDSLAPTPQPIKSRQPYFWDAFVSLNEPSQHVNSLVSLLTLSSLFPGSWELWEGRVYFSYAHRWFQG